MNIDLLDLIARGLAIWGVIYIVWNDCSQQVIAVAFIIVVILGIRKINEYIIIMLDKFRKSKKGNYPFFGGGGFDNTDEGNPIPPIGPGEAKEEAERVSGEEKPVEFETYIFKARKFGRANQWKEAADYLEEALLINPSNIPLRIQLSIIYGERLGNKEKAITHCNKILEIDPNNLSAKFNLAVYTNHLKKAQHSLPIYLEAEKMIQTQGLMGTEIDGKLNLFLGHDYRDIGKKEEAQKHYERAICILDRLASQGDKSSAFWLNNTKSNLNLLLGLT